MFIEVINESLQREIVINLNYCTMIERWDAENEGIVSYEVIFLLKDYGGCYKKVFELEKDRDFFYNRLLRTLNKDYEI